METLAVTSNAIPPNVLFPHFARPEIPKTLPLLAQLEDERLLLEQALAAFRAEVAPQAQSLTAA